MGQDGLVAGLVGRGVLDQSPDVNEAGGYDTTERSPDLLVGFYRCVLSHIRDSHAVGSFGMSMGFPMQEGWDEVLRSNIAKVDPVTGKVNRRGDGKVMKGPGWTPPNLESLLKDAQQ